MTKPLDIGVVCHLKNGLYKVRRRPAGLSAREQQQKCINDVIRVWETKITTDIIKSSFMKALDIGV